MLILGLFVFLLPISLSFVISPIWLTTEWHHPCVRTPVERDGVNNNNNNNNNHDNVYGAVIMTKVIARVHLVQLMNVH